MTIADRETRVPQAPPRRAPERTYGAPAPAWGVIGLAIVLLFGGAIAIASGTAARFASLYLLGGALGLVLYHAAFGFASSWRILLVDARGAGLRAQMLMLALATILILPAVAEGSLFGRPVGGAFAPVGVSVLVGAFLFGLGMQLGGGCASGTLYTVGGGASHMVITLVFFMAGSLIGTAHLPWWLTQPGLGVVSLPARLGVGGALLVQLSLFAAIAAFTVFVERRRHGHISHGFLTAPPPGRATSWQRFLRGPWPLLWGAVLLALLNAATVAIAGHPWTIVFGYTLWGAKAAAAFGLDLTTWEFWTWPYPRRALAGSLFAEDTSVMNFGILVGAFLAAGLAGRFAPRRRIPLGVALGAVAGGLLMGYGARLAFGCNIGAYFSGIASGSAHGWLWLVAGLAGSYLGTMLRPLFGLAVERRAMSRG